MNLYIRQENVFCVLPRVCEIKRFLCVYLYHLNTKERCISKQTKLATNHTLSWCKVYTGNLQYYAKIQHQNIYCLFAFQLCAVWYAYHVNKNTASSSVVLMTVKKAVALLLQQRQNQTHPQKKEKKKHYRDAIHHQSTNLLLITRR